MEVNHNNYSKYINMEDFGSNWFFYVEDLKIPKEDSKYIKPLSYEYSSFIWSQNINNEKHHFALLNEHEKMALQLNKTGYKWQDDWNNSTYENFRNYLSKHTIYNPYDKIIIFWQKEEAVETNWDIFLKHWTNFLFEDEGVINE